MRLARRAASPSACRARRRGTSPAAASRGPRRLRTALALGWTIGRHPRFRDNENRVLDGDPSAASRSPMNEGLRLGEARASRRRRQGSPRWRSVAAGRLRELSHRRVKRAPLPPKHYERPTATRVPSAPRRFDCACPNAAANPGFTRQSRGVPSRGCESSGPWFAAAVGARGSPMCLQRHSPVTITRAARRVVGEAFEADRGPTRASGSCPRQSFAPAVYRVGTLGREDATMREPQTPRAAPADGNG